MSLEANNNALRELKKKFIDGTIDDIPNGFIQYVNGWRESADAGVDPYCVELTDSARDMHVFDRIDDIKKCHLTYFDDYYESRNTVLDKLGGAIFYLDQDLVIFHKSGNKALLDELKSKGIRTGTKMSVENVGVFAGNIAIKKPFVNRFTYGETHYMSLLTDYACIARYGEATIEPNFRAVNLIILPLEKCAKNTISSIYFVLEAGDFTFKNRIMYPHIEKRFHLLEQSAQYSSDPLMLLDCNGEVAFINNRFENEFGILIKDAIGTDIDLLMPDISVLRNCLKSEQGITNKLVRLSRWDGKRQSYSIEAIPIQENRKTLGLKTMFHRVSANSVSVLELGAAEPDTIEYVGESETTAVIRATAQMAATTDVSIMITGEYGSGREQLARYIHSRSPCSAGPFVTLSYDEVAKEAIHKLERATPPAFYEKEILEKAFGGTLFIRNLSEMPLRSQSYLLHFLSSVGRKAQQSIRIIVCAEPNILEFVESGAVRKELYMQLNIVHISIPPLKSRVADIPALASYFTGLFSKKYNRHINGTSEATLELLKSYSWPGNVLELKSLIERCVLTAADDGPIILSAMPDDMALGTSALRLPQGEYEKERSLKGASYERIRALMAEYNGNKSKVAKALNISRCTLYKRLEEAGIV